MKGKWFPSKRVFARIHPTLQHCQQDTDLAGIRDPDAVAMLSADEKQACKKLRARVDAARPRSRNGWSWSNRIRCNDTN
jgi:hypothetical protein